MLIGGWLAPEGRGRDENDQSEAVAGALYWVLAWHTLGPRLCSKHCTVNNKVSDPSFSYKLISEDLKVYHFRNHWIYGLGDNLIICKHNDLTSIPEHKLKKNLILMTYACDSRAGQ